MALFMLVLGITVETILILFLSSTRRLRLTRAVFIMSVLSVSVNAS